MVASFAKVELLYWCKPNWQDIYPHFWKNHKST